MSKQKSLSSLYPEYPNMSGSFIYQNVKTYPSINSTNGGNIHSEENVRWLTRQLTDKPFIPVVGNPSESSNEPLVPVGGAGDYTFVSPGLINIDGRLFNLATDINHTSFDKSTTDGIKYMETQSVQRVVLDFMNGLSANMSDFLFTKYQYSEDLQYLEQWKLLETESENSPVEIGAVTINYNEKLTTLLQDDTQNCHNKFQQLKDSGNVKFSDGNTTCSITYPVYYGKSSGTIPTDTNSIFFTDVFDLLFVYDSNHTGSTMSYPGSRKSPDMDMFGDELTPELSSVTVIRSTAPKYLYDTTEYYTNSKNQVSTEKGMLYLRGSEESLTTKRLFNQASFIQNYGLKEISIENLYKIYKLQNAQDSDRIGDGIILSDHYYCLNTIPSNLHLTVGSTNTEIPIGFMDASGALMVNNLYGIITETVNGQSEEKMVIVLEGYGSWLKRMCQELGVAPADDIDHPEYSPNLEYSRKYEKEGEHTQHWFKYIKNWNTGIYGKASISSGANIALYQGIVGTSDTPTSIVSFSDVYNRWIAPYINLHLQIAWSSLCEYTLPNTEHNNEFMSYRAGKLLKDSQISGITSDGIYTRYQVTSTINTGSSSYEQTHEFSYPCDIYTDYQHIQLFADSSDTYTLLPDKVIYRPSLSDQIWNTNNSEDFINRLKRCKKPKSSSDDIIKIPYRVTTLNFNVDSNDFSDIGILIDTITETSVNTFIQDVQLDINTFCPVSNSYYSVDLETPVAESLPVLYELTMEPNYNNNWDRTTANFISGYKFNFNNNSWITCFPVLLIPSVDSQNYIKGEDLNRLDTYAGLHMEHTLPCNIQDKDAWIFNQWFGQSRTLRGHEIEANICSPIKGMDYINNYLKHRRNSFIHFNNLYGDNFITFEEYVQNQTNIIKNDITSEPQLPYSEAQLTRHELNPDILILKPVINTYQGIDNNIKKLKQETDSFHVDYKRSDSNFVILSRYNQYYEIPNIQNKLTITANFLGGLSDDSRVSLDKLIPLQDSVYSATIRFKFSSYCQLMFNIPYYTESDKQIHRIDWVSNYPITKDSAGNSTININTYDSDSYVTEAIADLTFTPSTCTCMIHFTYNPGIMSLADMSYLWKEFYKLDIVTWDQVSKLTEMGLASKLWKVGDSKTFTISDKNSEGQITSFEISAIIIGFDVDVVGSKKHTITWMSNILNDSELKNYGEPLYKTWEVHNLSSETFNKDWETLPVYKWLNNTSTGIYAKIDNELKPHIGAPYKNAGTLCAVQNDDESYTVKSYYTQKRYANYLWLPSLAELGLNTEYPETELSDAATLRVQYEGTNCYPYFALPHDQQRIKAITCLTRSSYMVVLNPTESNTGDAYEDYDSIPRSLYVVGTGYDNNQTDGRWLSVLTHSDVEGFPQDFISTEFCFVTR